MYRHVSVTPGIACRRDGSDWCRYLSPSNVKLNFNEHKRRDVVCHSVTVLDCLRRSVAKKRTGYFAARHLMTKQKTMMTKTKDNDDKTKDKMIYERRSNRRKRPDFLSNFVLIMAIRTRKNASHICVYTILAATKSINTANLKKNRLENDDRCFCQNGMYQNYVLLLDFVFDAFYHRCSACHLLQRAVQLLQHLSTVPTSSANFNLWLPPDWTEHWNRTRWTVWWPHREPDSASFVLMLVASKRNQQSTFPGAAQRAFTSYSIFSFFFVPCVFICPRDSVTVIAERFSVYSSIELKEIKLSVCDKAEEESS